MDSEMKLVKIKDDAILTLSLFLEHVPAGFPPPAADYIEDHINLNSELIRHPENTYLLRVEGSSMIDDNIFNGDVIIVDSAVMAVTAGTR